MTTLMKMMIFVKLRQLQRRRMNEEKKDTNDTEEKITEETKGKDDD